MSRIFISVDGFCIEKKDKIIQIGRAKKAFSESLLIANVKVRIDNKDRAYE